MLLEVDQPETVGNLAEIGKRRIGRHRHLDGEAIAFAVFREIGNTFFDRVLWRVDRKLAPIEGDFAGIKRIGPEDRPRDFRSSRAHKSGKTEDFTAPQ
ncbi:hypothetical protein D3C86_1169770 [compost metagenome]